MPRLLQARVSLQPLPASPESEEHQQEAVEEQNQSVGCHDQPSQPPGTSTAGPQSEDQAEHGDKNDHKDRPEAGRRAD